MFELTDGTVKPQENVVNMIKFLVSMCNQYNNKSDALVVRRFD